MADDVDRLAGQEQLERRRLARLVDALPVVSGFTSPDGHLVNVRPETSESFIWALPAFAYAHDSITQIVDLCERAAAGERIQIERPYFKETRDRVDIFGRGLITLSPIEDEKGHIDEIALTLIDCDENGLTPTDSMAKTRLTNANARIESMLSLAQIVIEATRSSRPAKNRKAASGDSDLRNRLTLRLDALASVIDMISDPDRASLPIRALLDAAMADVPDALRKDRLKIVSLDGSVPIAMVPLMALLLSELIDNARRFGAWRGPDETRQGHVSLESDLVDGTKGRMLRLHWIEDGGPNVSAVLGRGFGITLAKRLFPQITGGTTHLLNSEDGLSWTFEMPIGTAGQQIDEADFAS